MMSCQEAIEWLHERPEVLKTRGIGVTGISKGAELALHMAAFNPKVSLLQEGLRFLRSNL